MMRAADHGILPGTVLTHYFQSRRCRLSAWNRKHQRRPRQLYTGPAGRAVVPIAARATYEPLIG